MISHPVGVRIADTTAPQEQITCAMWILLPEADDRRLSAEERRYQCENEGHREQQHNRDNDGHRREAIEIANQHSRLHVLSVEHGRLYDASRDRAQ